MSQPEPKLYRHESPHSVLLHCTPCHAKRTHICGGDLSQVRCTEEEHGVCTSCGARIKRTTIGADPEVPPPAPKPKEKAPFPGAFLCKSCGLPKPKRWLAGGICNQCRKEAGKNDNNVGMDTQATS
ncbi:MAG: hypothetical protein K2X77_18435 [Candidatus Obscuribacterales bacterium]|nr:hypothetical protein [Candidatus Obscuribacterales bacterium]